MSNVTAPISAPHIPQWDDFRIPNPSISSDKWHFTEDDKVYKTKTIEALIPAGTLIVTLFLLSKFGLWSLLPESFARSDVAGWAWLTIFFSMLVGSFFFASKVAKRAVASSERKRNEYRAQNASLIIDALAEKGWTIVSKDAVKTLIEDNNPYVTNANGTRHYVRQFHIGRENISFVVALSDAEVEQTMQNKEKQSRIDFLIKKYEYTNGIMSPEKKAGFIAALKMSL